MSKPFRFKEFSLKQSKASFKVGTDSILLGSWVNKNLKNINQVLDIGTGTGILALMLAQKFPEARIDAIDLLPEHHEIADFNFSNSPWNSRLKSLNTSLQNFKPKKKYNLIICNPPYFKNSLTNPSISKTIARHSFSDSLSMDELLTASVNLLTEEGYLYFCLPFIHKDEIEELCKQLPLNINKTTIVKAKLDKPPYLMLYQLGMNYPTPKGSKEESTKEKELIIQNASGSYTNEFIELTKAYYLNL